MTSKNLIFENDIEEEDIEEEEEEIIEEEIIDGEECLLPNDSDNESEDYDDEDILEDLDTLINELEDDDLNNKIVEKIVEKRTSFNILTKYEKNFILGFRTQQIINGSVVLIDVNLLKEKTAYNIAFEELMQKKIPFKIKRNYPDGKIEIWDIEDLIIL